MTPPTETGHHCLARSANVQVRAERGLLTPIVGQRAHELRELRIRDPHAMLGCRIRFRKNVLPELLERSDALRLKPPVFHAELAISLRVPRIVLVMRSEN